MHRLAADPLVGGLLVLHDLHPVPRRAPGRAALDAVRPYLGSHAGGVELLGIDDDGGAAALEGAATAARPRGHRDAGHREGDRGAAPEIAGVDVEGVAEPRRARCCRSRRAGRRLDPLPARSACDPGMNGRAPLTGRRAAPRAPRRSVAVPCELCGVRRAGRREHPHRRASARASRRLLCTCRPCGLPVRSPPGAGGGRGTARCPTATCRPGVRAHRRRTGTSCRSRSAWRSSSTTRCSAASSPATRARRAPPSRAAARRLGGRLGANPLAADARARRRGAARAPRAGAYDACWCRSTPATSSSAWSGCTGRGFDGGAEAWAAIDGFFADLRRPPVARLVRRAGRASCDVRRASAARPEPLRRRARRCRSGLRVARAVDRARACTPSRCAARSASSRSRGSTRRRRPTRLADLFGEPARWGERSSRCSSPRSPVMVPGFTGSTEVDRARCRCTYDLEIAADALLPRPRRRRDPAAAAVQRHGLHAGHDGVAGRAGAVARGGAATGCRSRCGGRRWTSYFPGGGWLRLRRDTSMRSPSTSPARPPRPGTTRRQLLERAGRRPADDDAIASPRPRAVADAVLYEGYLLYPYRASAQKNQVRWQFGRADAAGPRRRREEPSASRTECLVELPAESCTSGRSASCTSQAPDGPRRAVSTRPSSGDGSTPPVARAELLAGEPFAITRGRAETVDGDRRRSPAAARGAWSRAAGADEVPGPYGVLRLRLRRPATTPWPSRARRATRRCGRRWSARTCCWPPTAGSFVSMTDPPEWARRWRPSAARTSTPGRCWPARRTAPTCCCRLADHPRRPPGDRAGERRRPVRRHRERRDPDPAHDGADRRGEGGGAGHRPAGGRDHRPGRRAAAGDPGPAARRDPHAAPRLR